MRLAGKAALVTGAGRGLGAAIARRFALEGASVVCADRDRGAAESTAAAIVEDSGRAVAECADVTVPHDCVAQVTRTVEAFGRVDIAVSNAGIGLHRLMLDTGLDDWERVLKVNLTGAFLTLQAAARTIVAQGGGRIVQIGSISGQRGNMAGAAYGASKAAVMHLCKVMSVELAAQGVMVNAIAPGPIDTGISVHGPSRRRGYLDRIPAGAYGTPEAVANAAVFLASNECQWLSGHILNVDGGYGSAGLTYDRSELPRGEGPA